MALLIASKDILERWRDGRLAWAGGLVLLLVLTALAVGYARQSEVRAEQAVASRLDYQDWLRQDRRHPHDAAHQGLHAFRPEPALAIVDPGINPYIGGTLWLQAHRQAEVKFRPAQDATGLQRFGDLSPAWVLQILGPLLVIVLGFNALAGEREQGILRQTLSLGVSPWRLLAGKALALAGSLALLLVPAALAAAAAVAWGAEAGERLDALARFAALSLGYALYLGAFVFLVLGVSALASSSRIAITVLLGLWIGAVVIAPRVLSEVSRLAYPSPTKLEFQKELGANLKATSDKVWQQAFGTTERWGRDVPLSQWGLALQIDDQSAYGVYDRHYGRLWDTYEQQQRVQEWSGLLLPLLAVRAYSMGLAGTDFGHHRDFTNAAERHRRLIQDVMSTDLVAHADPLGDQHFAYQAGPDLWAKVPPFHYHAPPAGWALARHAHTLAVLAANLLLALGFALWAVRRQRAI
ncbi:ABC transporter permease subunit [Ramlibacter tataouinensis]|uniref:Permease component of an ABC transporteur-like protein n=1 Tax=Ramlibacter tataouinensis (strain ATCC BAA-407 / DSM 14655 / LMG 21543 / TTB310) TaxID=365046 RepID=F5XW21_RAMTT|nr:ABC transporter permease subunit [Ramlibacter tataouinensis]AEG94124.1 permease component of an ABC transporteur-like protein [Ramlibacter tataouinensis TTB310]